MSVSFVGRGSTSCSGPLHPTDKRLTSRDLSLHLCFSFSLFLIFLPSRSLCFSSQLVCLYRKLPPTQWCVPLSLPFYLYSFCLSLFFFCLRLMKICLITILTSSHIWNSRYTTYNVWMPYNAKWCLAWRNNSKICHMATKNNCFSNEDLSSDVLSLKYLKIISELEDFTHIHWYILKRES